MYLSHHRRLKAAFFFPPKFVWINNDVVMVIALVVRLASSFWTVSQSFFRNLDTFECLQSIPRFGFTQCFLLIRSIVPLWQEYHRGVLGCLLQPVRCHVSLICPTVDGVHLYHLVKLLSVKFLYCRIIIFSLCNKYFVGNTLKMYKNSIPHQNSSLFNLFVSIWTHICLFYSVCYNQFISLWWCSICSQCSW